MAIRNDLTLNNGAATDFIVLQQFLERPESHDVFDRAFTSLKFNKNQGEVVHVSRLQNPSVDTTASNGVTNKAPRALSRLDYTATVNEYNESVAVSRREVQLSSLKDVLKEHGAVMANWQVPETRQAVRWGILKAGTNKFYNSGAISSAGNVNGTVNANMLERMVRSLDNARGKTFFPKLDAKNAYNSTGVESSYLAFCHPDLKADLRLLPGFKTADMYAADMYEFGAWQNIRFFCTPTATPDANTGAASTTLKATGATGSTSGNADVYSIVIVSKDSCHATPIKGSGINGIGNVSTTVLDKADKSDIHNKYIVISATWYDTALITCQEWIAVGLCGASRL